MRAKNLMGTLLAIALFFSLFAPALIVGTISVGTVKASPDTIFSDNFSTAIDSSSRYDDWFGDESYLGWQALSNTTGAPKQGAGRLGLLPSTNCPTPWIYTKSFATTGYYSIQISFKWALELDGGRTTLFETWWSTDASTWTHISGADYTPDTDGAQKIISYVSVGSDT